MKANKPTRNSSIHGSREASRRYKLTGSMEQSGVKMTDSLSATVRWDRATPKLRREGGEAGQHRVIRRDLVTPGDLDALVGRMPAAHHESR